MQIQTATFRPRISARCSSNSNANHQHQLPLLQTRETTKKYQSTMSASSATTVVSPASPALKEQWPPRSGQEFDWSKPTFEAYASQSHEYAASFQRARQKLDYSYHKNPLLERQQFQDRVLQTILDAAVKASESQTHSTEEKEESKSSLESSVNENDSRDHERPWIVFSAGPMAAGKSYVLTQLHHRNLFPLDQFVTIDPDKLKSELPEMAGYLAQDPESAATKVHRESTQMADVLFEHALEQRYNILVDGSLRDVDWYQTLFKRLRREVPHYRLAILHVSADPDTIRHRARTRAELSGRAVPTELLEASMRQVPRSVGALEPLTNVTCEISNNDGHAMELVKYRVYNEVDGVVVESMENNDVHASSTWERFRQLWMQGGGAEQEEGRTDHSESDEQSSSISHNNNSTIDQRTQHVSIECQLLSAPLDPEQREMAKNAWQKSYPNLCMGCTLFADGQCGICIHETHICACALCSGKHMTCTGASAVVNE